MNIQKKLLTISKYTRTRNKRKKTTKIAWHYVGNTKSTAINNRNYFESLKDGVKSSNGSYLYASSHYIIGLEGEIIQCVPDDEIAYTTNSANAYSIGIETCHINDAGQYSNATYQSMIELGSVLCKKYGLNPTKDFICHYDVTGKICPKWFVTYPEKWEQFKSDCLKRMLDYIPTVAIKYTSNKIDIMWLQSKLNDKIKLKNFIKLNIDGIWGEKTDNALINYYNQIHLEVGNLNKKGYHKATLKIIKFLAK